MTDLSGKTVAFLLKRGVEQPELTKPWATVASAGGKPVLVSEEHGTITALIGDWDRGDDFTVDVTLDEADPADYDALVLPGGVANGDRIRLDEQAVTLVRDFFEQHKPVAAICHGGWILADADVLDGRRVTSYPSLRTDLRNAGATWVDEEVVVDQGLVTSRTPDDLPAFNAKLVEEIAEGKHSGQTA